MPYSPRLLEPDTIYFITSRTIDGTLFLRPSPALNEAIREIIASAQSRYGVELFEFVVLSNHIHLVVRSIDERIPQFMQYVKANIALVVNRMLGRRGYFWERRYTASPILDVGAESERASYVYGHGVKEGLVASAEHWPGVASVKERLRREHEYHDRRDSASRKREVSGGEVPDAAVLRADPQPRLSCWPFLNELPREQIRERVRELVEEAALRGRQARNGLPPLGVRGVLAQDPWSRPNRELERSPNPRCHASSPSLRRHFLARWSQFLGEYTSASRAFRDGDLGATFPAHSFRPPLPRTWRDCVGPPQGRA